jgi:hypothetical protein
MKINLCIATAFFTLAAFNANAQKGPDKITPEKGQSIKPAENTPPTETKPKVLTPGTLINAVKPTTSPSNSSPKPKAPEPTVAANPVFESSNDLITGNDSSQVNWSKQYVQAKGWAIIDETRFPNPNQAKLMAMSGAKAVAQRNLLEMIQGVNITSEVTVRDFSTQSDAITTKVEGLLKNAEMVGEPVVKNGTVEVLMRVPLYPKGNTSNSLAGAVYDGVQNSGDTLKNRLSSGRMAIGRSGQTNSEAPVLFPKLLDSSGNEVVNYLKDFKNEGVKTPQFIKNTQENLLSLKSKNITEIVDAKLNNGNVVIPNLENLKVDKWKKIGNIALKVGKLILLFI